MLSLISALSRFAKKNRKSFLPSFLETKILMHFLCFRWRVSQLQTNQRFRDEMKNPVHDIAADTLAIPLTVLSRSFWPPWEEWNCMGQSHYCTDITCSTVFSLRKCMCLRNCPILAFATVSYLKLPHVKINIFSSYPIFVNRIFSKTHHAQNIKVGTLWGEYSLPRLQWHPWDMGKVSL